MPAERATYLDSSAIVKLVVEEPESVALRAYLRRRRPAVSSAVSRTEVVRALLPLGAAAVGRGQEALAKLGLLRVNDRILRAAGTLLPPELRTLDAIHLATALDLGDDLARLVTYDERLREAAASAGCSVVAPA
jgi:predicted nucleic acid-binding protein